MNFVKWAKLSIIVVLFSVVGCQTVDVTKTGKGIHEATQPADVEILVTIPERPYIELATVSTTGWKPKETAKMHNALRAKSAPLGASAVILSSSGVLPNKKLWSTGVAIKFKE